MKTIKLFYFILFISFFGCTPSTYYQLYNMESNHLEAKGNVLIYENDDIKVTYNFWENYGNSSFKFTNKTDLNVFVDLKKSHLIINGIANTYFQNRSFSESSSSIIHFSTFSEHISRSPYYVSLNMASTQSQISGTKASSVTYIEQDIVIVPANSAKFFSGFNLNTTLYRDCYLLRFPSTRNIRTSSYNEEITPLHFVNIISYGFYENDQINFKEIKNHFWVSEITNYPRSEFMESRHPEFCGERSRYTIRYPIFISPNKFFIRYIRDKSTSGPKH